MFPWQIQSLVPQQWHQLDMPLGTVISIHRYDMIGMQNIKVFNKFNHDTQNTQHIKESINLFWIL